MKLKLLPLFEKFIISDNILDISEPYDSINKIMIGDTIVYCLFGNVDYYDNRDSILAIKGKSENLHVDVSSYNRFLDEFKTRFNSIPELRLCELLVSIETTARVNSDIMEKMDIPYVMNGLTKIDKNFRMRSIPKGERENVSDIFNLNFDISNNSNICILDDFITTGSSFKNAFIKLPETINKVGVCLFKLDSYAF